MKDADLERAVEYVPNGSIKRQEELRPRLRAEVVRPSPIRTEPPCPFYTKGCGGCQWQHADYEEQLKIKRHLLEQKLG